MPPQRVRSRPRLRPLRRATSSTSLAWNVLQHNIVAATYAHVASVCRAGLRGNACPFCPVGYGTRLCGCVVVGYGSKADFLSGSGTLSLNKTKESAPGVQQPPSAAPLRRAACYLVGAPTEGPQPPVAAPPPPGAFPLICGYTRRCPRRGRALRARGRRA